MSLSRHPWARLILHLTQEVIVVGLHGAGTRTRELGIEKRERNKKKRREESKEEKKNKRN